MNRRSLAALSFIVVLVSSVGAARAAITTSQDLQRVCDEFYSLDLDPARAHDVTNATLTRDIGTIRMTKGVVIFSKAIEGITPVAVFIGDGSFTVTPIRKMDRDMLNIAAKDHLNKDVGGMINTSADEAVLFSYDKSWEELKPSLSPARAAKPDEIDRARKILKDRLDTIDKSTSSLRSGEPSTSAFEFDLIARALAVPRAVGAQDAPELNVEIDTADYGWLAYGWLPDETNEVRLGARGTLGANFTYFPLVVAHKKADLDAAGRYAADPNVDLHETVKVRRYRMNLEIADLSQINIDVDATFTPMLDGTGAVGFALVNDTRGPNWNSRAKWVDVKSIKDASGNDLSFLHRKNALVVLLKEKAAKDKDVTLSFKLLENTISQLSNVSYSLLNTFPWFPQYGYLGGHYEIDWTIKTVKPLTATGSGKTVKSWEEGNMNAVQMIFDRPVQFPSIIFGRFQVEGGEYDSATSGAKVELATHFWPNTLFPVGGSDFEINVPATKPRDVNSEGKEIIKFMEGLYGPFPFEKLDVAMMSPGLGFGQSPPAFVQLTGEAFMSSAQIANFPQANADFFHEFFSHEIAHQWWGHKIGWVSDEDTWLSESYAEYSAGLYTLSYLGKDRFESKMKKWKQNAEIGDPHGSISWCTNLSGPQGFTWYTDLIYNKGPYVVHMLRMQMGLENFKKAMQSVFAKYGFTSGSTAQIQRECELVMGYKLDYFFDQWFRGTGIPTFDYSWADEPTPDGKHLVSIKISQRDKQNFKQVLMPVYIYFKGQKEPLIKARAITTADHVYQLKLPEKPVKITLDEDHDILGDMIPSGAGTGQ